jgi:dihydrofolate reductase
MTDLTLVAAVAKNRVIGKGGGIPWKIPEDMKRFKKLTSGQAVIMGRKTFESIGKPLLNRYNFVVSSKEIDNLGLCVVSSLDEAIEIVNLFTNKAYVIGGQRIYEEAIHKANRMELTEISRDYEGDRFFPEFDKDDWNETSRIDDSSGDYSFVTYFKK